MVAFTPRSQPKGAGAKVAESGWGLGLGAGAGGWGWGWGWGWGLGLGLDGWFPLLYFKRNFAPSAHFSVQISQISPGISQNAREFLKMIEFLGGFRNYAE